MNPNELPKIIDDADEPKIVKIAKLVLLLTDNSVEYDTKVGCILIDIQNGLITQKEAMELVIYLPELQDFL